MRGAAARRGTDLNVLTHAAELVITTQFGSTPFLQRRLGVSFLVAGQLLDELEGHGIVGPHRTEGARDVLVPVGDLDAALIQVRGQAGLPGCVFCDLIAADRVLLHSWPAAVAFVPRHPVVEDGHLLVVPRRHVPDATTDPVLTGEVMRHAAELALAWPAANLLTSIGSDATQTVFHLHIHLVRRRAGDGLSLPWTGQRRPHTTARGGR